MGAILTQDRPEHRFYMIWGRFEVAFWRSKIVKIVPKIKLFSCIPINSVFYDRRPQKLQREVPKPLQNGGFSWSWTKHQNHASACTGAHFSRFQPLENHIFSGPFFHVRFESSRKSVFLSFCIKKSSQRVPKFSKNPFENRVKNEPLKINDLTPF